MKRKRIHCIGVKGIGLSALAQILASEGHDVSGSDIADPFPADAALRSAGIDVRTFSEKNISKGIDEVIASNAYLAAGNSKSETGNSKIHPEIAEAKRRGIPVRSYPQALGRVFRQKRGIAVSGSHGKSTTSALLAVTLEALGEDPYAVIGAVVKSWGSNARVPKNPPPSTLHPRLFVIEADEYRRAFYQYAANIAVVLGVDWDHPDVFRTRGAYQRAFGAFMRRVKPGGHLVVNGDSAEVLQEAAGRRRGVQLMRFGHDKKNDIRITDIRHSGKGIAVDLSGLGTFEAALYGEHHAMNVAASVAVCHILGHTAKDIRRAMKTFRGTVRRFDIYQKRPAIVDDYAHHPAEIGATIEAARQAFSGRRVRILFQPHTFSRTEKYFDEFVSALESADDIGLLETYGSAREASGGKTAKDLARASGAPYFASHNAALRYYREDLKNDDVLLIVGAGDGNLLAARLSRR